MRSEAVAERTPEAAPRFPLETRDRTELDAGQDSQELALSRQNAIVRAAERVAPGVVTISVIRTQQVRTSFFDMFGGTRLQRSGGYGSSPDIGITMQPAKSQVNAGARNKGRDFINT